MRKEVMLVTGAGQISMAVARRIGHGKKIILGDREGRTGRMCSLQHLNYLY